jgi:Uma2 family endonuclease
MATIIETKQAVLPAEQRVVLRGVSWATYEALVAETGDHHVRMVYDRGVLELMSPGPLHERLKDLTTRLFEEVMIELGLPFETVGEARWTKVAAERGLEADGCYYLSAEKLAIVRGRAPDRPDDPYPDLAIEIEISRSSVNKLAIYADLGTPEVWRHDGVDCVIQRLRDDGTYEERPDSLFLPPRPADIVRWVEQSQGQDHLAWRRQVRAWVRDELAARPRQGG